MGRGNNGDHRLLSILAQQQAPQPQAATQIAVAAPLNDVQLVALMAAQLTGVPLTASAAERVALALDLVAQAVVQMPTLDGKIRQLQAAV